GYESASAYGKIFGEARKSGLGRMRMIDICERHAHKARGSAFGPSHFADHDEVLGAAFGHATSDLPKLLQAGTQRMLLAFFALTPTTYQQWCQIGSLPDFRPMDMITVSETPELESLAVGEDVNEGKVRERYETAQLGTYAKGVSFDRRTLINDDLGAVSRVLQAWGSGAAALPDKLAYLQLTSNPTMQDGVTLFHASRGNVYTSAVLSHVSLTAAITAFMTQVGFGDDARYIDIAPRYLLVPTALWPIAEQITKSQYDPTAGNANSLVPNVVGDKVTPVVSRRLHAASAAKWYLAADPNNQPLVVVNFLNGRREPIVTQVGNGSILGARYEVIFDCNAKAVQPEAGGSNAGG
ncbi:MAG: hypothetical protein ACREJO_18020, partial [Phycisphaerales bacterium]